MIYKQKCLITTCETKEWNVSLLCYSINGFKPGMLRLETCMGTLVFEQSSCWKYCMLVGEICGHRMTFILVKKKKNPDTKWKNTLYPTVQHCLTWQCSLPVLKSSCTGVISECHSNLGTKQGTGLTTNWNTSHQHLSSYKNIIVPLLCSNLEESSLGYTETLKQTVKNITRISTNVTLLLFFFLTTASFFMQHFWMPLCFINPIWPWIGFYQPLRRLTQSWPSLTSLESPSLPQPRQFWVNLFWLCLFFCPPSANLHSKGSGGAKTREVEREQN